MELDGFQSVKEAIDLINMSTPDFHIMVRRCLNIPVGGLGPSLEYMADSL